MKDIKDYDLIIKYKDCTDKDKDKIYNEFYRRYKDFLVLQANSIYKSIGKRNRMEFEDCELDAMECLNLALNWIDLSKFKGDKDKFNLSYYIKLQVSAKINSYVYTVDKKQKKEIYYVTMDFNDVHNNKQSYKGYYKAKFEDEISYKDFHNNFNKQLCENQIKIKRCMMRGFKDYKIKSILGITNYEYEKLKEKLKENILTYGLYSANI
jgi:hypothetical protein